MFLWVQTGMFVPSGTNLCSIKNHLIPLASCVHKHTHTPILRARKADKAFHRQCACPRLTAPERRDVSLCDNPVKEHITPLWQHCLFQPKALHWEIVACGKTLHQLHNRQTVPIQRLGAGRAGCGAEVECASHVAVLRPREPSALTRCDQISLSQNLYRGDPVGRKSPDNLRRTLKVGSNFPLQVFLGHFSSIANFSDALK